MKCGKVTDLMSEYIDDCLPGSVRVEFELHIRSCHECSEELAQMRDMVSSLHSLSGQRAPVDCWTAVQARIVLKESVWTVFVRYLMRPYVAGPVFALGILLALFLAWPSPIDDSEMQYQVHAPSMKMTATQPEFVQFIGAHNRVEHEQTYIDPDVTFIAVEMERVSPR